VLESFLPHLVVEAGKPIGAGRGERAVEAGLLDEGGRAVGDGGRGLAGIDVYKEGGQPFRDQSFGVGI
jgi:hypothetical protein